MPEPVVREIRTPATITALNHAIEDHDIKADHIISVILTPFTGHLGQDGAQFRIIYREIE